MVRWYDVMWLVYTCYPVYLLGTHKWLTRFIYCLKYFPPSMQIMKICPESFPIKPLEILFHQACKSKLVENNLKLSINYASFKLMLSQNISFFMPWYKYEWVCMIHNEKYNADSPIQIHKAILNSITSFTSPKITNITQYSNITSKKHINSISSPMEYNVTTNLLFN